MQLWNIERAFPVLTASGYEITSEITDLYNCVAWAAGDDTDWWSHEPEYYWPEWAPRSPEVEALVQVFVGLGYTVCDSAEKESGYDKVALYARDGEWQHAARQLEDGQGTSKVGPFEDITHPSLENLTNETYGNVYCIMRRPSAAAG